VGRFVLNHSIVKNQIETSTTAESRCSFNFYSPWTSVRGRAGAPGTELMKFQCMTSLESRELAKAAFVFPDFRFSCIPTTASARYV
jgi:hypothetical protein